MREMTAEQKTRPRRLSRSIAIMLLGSSSMAGCNYQPVSETPPCEYQEKSREIVTTTEQVIRCLGGVAVQGRAAKTGYDRDKFGDGWGTVEGCSTREHILERDLTNDRLSGCKVLSGDLRSPYSGKVVNFERGEGTSSIVQIDHIVSLSDAWQKGADEAHMGRAERERFANDPKNLLAVYGPENQAKSDGDAATWLPQNKTYRCEMVASQTIVKREYDLWMTPAEHKAIKEVLATCPGETLHLPN